MEEERRPQGCSVLFLSGIFRSWNRHRRTASTPPAVVSDTNPPPPAPPPPPRGSTQPKRTVLMGTSVHPPVAKSTSAPSKLRADPVGNPPLAPAPTSNGALLRATSGNVMIYGNLGNLGGYCRTTPDAPNRNVLDFLPKTAKELRMDSTKKKQQPESNGSKKKSNTLQQAEEPRGELCRALSRRLGLEELTTMGNEEYRKGRLSEALASYERAIVMDPNKASYRCSKAVALAGLGRLLDAVAECREAIRINPCYYKAHYWLATLYLRLGEPDKAIHHYKQSRREAGAVDISRAQAIKTDIAMCYEARKTKDWIAVLKESQSVTFDGADCSPQVYSQKNSSLSSTFRNKMPRT